AAALQASLDAILARHEVLRTVYTEEDGRALQLILPPHPLAMTLSDLSQLSATAAEAAAALLLQQEGRRPFDLQSGPIIRALLLKLQADHFVLMINLHHIAGDGWSVGIFNRELSQFYRATCEGERLALPALPVQYADYAVWQRQWLRGDVLQRQLDYWRGQLAQAPRVLEVAPDRVRPAVQSYVGGYVGGRLGAALSGGLKQQSREQGVTLYMSLLAAYVVLLWRYSGAEVVCVGTPIANRRRAEIEGLIGCVVNTLVMRGDVRGGVGYAEVVRRVREMALGAYTHQDMPFEVLVEELEPERSMSHSPLFQVMFTMQGGDGGGLELSGVEVSGYGMKVEEVKYDLGLTVREQGEEGVVVMEYSAGMYEEETVRRMVRQYERIVAAMVARRETRIEAAGMLSEEEEEEVLRRWNATRREYEVERSIVEAVEEQAAAGWEAVAVVAGDEQVSYGELERRGNRLGNYLVGLGAKV